MKTRTVTDVQANLTKYLDADPWEPVIVTQDGKTVGILLAITDEEEAERLATAYSPKVQAILAASEEQIRKEGGIPHDEFWQAVANRTKANKKKRRLSTKSRAK